MSRTRQQVNLYQPVSTTARESFSAGTAVQLTAIAAMCLVSFWAYGLWRVQRLQHTVNLLRQQQQHQAETLAALTTARATGVNPEQLESRVKLLSAKLAAHTRALELVRNGFAGQTGGFSHTLSALARHPVEGLWIDHIVLSGLSEARMSLGGVALDPERVPRYLHALATEQALVGLRFDDLTIERPSSSSLPAPASSQQQPEPLQQRGFIFKAGSTTARPAAMDRHS